jgi:cobalt-zinc-cadmium efflux system outer membrane protein
MTLLLPCLASAPAESPDPAQLLANAPGSQNPSNDVSPATKPVPATPGGAEVLTLTRALALAGQNSPRLHGASAASARALAAIDTAKAYTNPLVEIFTGNQSARKVRTPGVPGLLQHYAAYQTLEIPPERRARLRVAELGYSSTELAATGIHLSLVADVKHAFYEVLHRKEEVGHSQENLALVEDLRRRVEVEVRVGEKGRLELTRAEAELARARFIVRSAQIELANSIALLRVAIAAPADENLDPRGDLEPQLKLPPLPELREQVLRTHPAIVQSQTDVQQAQASLTHQQTLRLPQPVLFAEYEKQPDLTFWRAGVTVPLPFWDRRKGPIAGAQSAVRESAALLDQRRLEVISALERAYEQYELADQQVTSLQSGSLHEAESAVDAAKAAYRFGERGIVEVLDAQRVLQSVRGDLLGAQFSRQSALIDLEELGAVTPGGRP